LVVKERKRIVPSFFDRLSLSHQIKTLDFAVAKIYNVIEDELFFAKG
jgi:hypothetical protein